MNYVGHFYPVSDWVVEYDIVVSRGMRHKHANTLVQVVTSRASLRVLSESFEAHKQGIKNALRGRQVVLGDGIRDGSQVFERLIGEPIRSNCHLRQLRVVVPCLSGRQTTDVDRQNRVRHTRRYRAAGGRLQVAP